MQPFTRTEAGITFAVSDVTRATTPLPEVPYAQALAATLGTGSVRGDAPAGRAVIPLEAYSRDTRPLVSLRTFHQTESLHPFIHALNIAYDEHRPFVMSPDMIWLLIAQGFALHVNANAEALRSRFVAHDGKARIAVIRDEFVRGFAGNDWEGVFADFSQNIRAHVGAKAHDLIVPHFSTTGIVEKAAFEITLMDAFQNYFSFVLRTRCGIPEVTLEGTPEDWEAVRTNTEALREFDLAWWTEHLLPVLAQFISASRGEMDLDFWGGFYKLSGGSGGPYITGHVLNLFPYLVSARPSPQETDMLMRHYTERMGLPADEARARVEKEAKERTKPSRNRHLGWTEAQFQSNPFTGMSTSSLPSALSVAPFVWKYDGTELPMELVAGFIGAAQDQETLALRPEIGWAVRDAPRS